MDVGILRCEIIPYCGFKQKLQYVKKYERTHHVEDLGNCLMIKEKRCHRISK